MEPMPGEISIVTLNCWGLKYISKQRCERLSEIGRQLAKASPTPHIVGLQECWTQEDYRAIRRETRFILPYGKFYHSGAFGGGLAILSRWPIEASSMFRYPLNGRPTAFFRGDWFVGKGVAYARIRYGPSPAHVVEVFNTHTHAPYEHGPDDSYLCHRVAQAWEIAKLLRGAAERGHLVLALGDFNMIPLSLEHRIITAHAPVRDVWRVLHPDSSVGPADHPAEQARRRPIPTAEFNILENGAASDGPYNTWRWSKQQQKLLGPGKPEVVVPPDTIDRRGKRLDYIFVSAGPIPALQGSWAVTRAKVGMMMRHPELGCSLSDHFAVEATLAFTPHQPHHHLAQPQPRSDTTRSATGGAPPHHRPSKQLSARPDSETIVGTDHPFTMRHNKEEDYDHDDEPEEEDYKFDARTVSTHIPTSALQNGTFLHITTEEGAPSPTPSISNHSVRSPSPAPPLPNSRKLPTSPLANSTIPQTPDQQPSSPTTPDNNSTTKLYDEILAIAKKYTRRERSQKKWRARHFFFWVVVWIGCLVGVWFSPANYVSFVLMLVSSLGLTAGTVDGLMALLFFKAELRALREFEWEVLNAKAFMGGGGGGNGIGSGQGDDDLDHDRDHGHDERAW